MSIKWITAEQVKAYATTPKRALDISVRHHQQNVDITKSQLRGRDNLLNEDLCGLCYYYREKDHGGCDSCPLTAEDGISCFRASSLYKKSLPHYRSKNHKSFIKAETALLNKLKSLQSGDDMDKTQTEIVETLIGELSSATKKAEGAMKESRLEDERKALLAEIEGLEPELRVGDYGYYKDQLSPANGPDSFIVYGFDGCDTLFRQGNRAGRSRAGKKFFQQHVIVTLGNIFADLAAQAEPLERFEVKRDEHNIIKAYHGQCMDDKNSEGIQFEATCNGETTTVLFPIDQATEIHRKLGRLIAKLKLDKNNV